MSRRRVDLADSPVVATDVQPIVRRPDFDFMRPRLSRWIAMGFGAGLAPLGPGSVGTALAWLLYVLLIDWIGWYGMAVTTVAGFFVGIWAIGRVGEDLGDIDHGAIVWDEVVAFWLVLLLIPQTVGAQTVGFILFRVFDVWKPTPIRQAERRWQTPVGVLFDDLLAAAYVLALFTLWSAMR